MMTFEIEFARSLLRSSVSSLLVSVFKDRKKEDGDFNLTKFAEMLGKHKSTVSRDFGNPPNWTLDTIADMARVLNVEVVVRAVDRESGKIFKIDDCEVGNWKNITAPSSVLIGPSSKRVESIEKIYSDSL